MTDETRARTTPTTPTDEPVQDVLRRLDAVANTGMAPSPHLMVELAEKAARAIRLMRAERDAARGELEGFEERIESAVAYLREGPAVGGVVGGKSERRIPTSREVMKAGGVDPDAPFVVGPFPSRMRQSRPHPVDVLVEIWTRNGVTVEPGVEAELRAICDAPAGLDPEVTEALRASFAGSCDPGAAGAAMRAHAGRLVIDDPRVGFEVVDEVISLLRGYEAHHRDEAFACRARACPGITPAESDRLLGLAETRDRKAERNADMAERLNQWVVDTIRNPVVIDDGYLPRPGRSAADHITVRGLRDIGGVPLVLNGMPYAPENWSDGYRKLALDAKPAVEFVNHLATAATRGDLELLRGKTLVEQAQAVLGDKGFVVPRTYTTSQAKHAYDEVDRFVAEKWEADDVQALIGRVAAALGLEPVATSDANG